MEYEIYWRDGFFEVVTRGEAEGKVFEEYIEVLLSHEKWKPGTPFLSDHTELKVDSLTVEDVYSIAEVCALRKARFGKSRCALYVGQDLGFGLTRMWEVYVEGKWDVIEALFKSRDEAISWLLEE